VIFDAKGKNFRHKIYKDYKANRSSMPVELSEQVLPIIQFIESLGIKVLQVPNVEADDVIGTLAAFDYGKNINIIISSGDKDLAQLVNDNVTLINSMDEKRLDIKGVIDKFGVHPKKIFDYLVLVGDTSDNIPGVDKIGPKTAVTLLEKYGSIDGIIENIDLLKGKVQENLGKSSQTIELAKKLIKLKTDVDINLDLKKYIIGKRDESKLSEIASKYELKNSTNYFSIEENQKKENKKSSYSLINSEEGLIKLIANLKKYKVFSFDTETTSLNAMEAQLVGVSFSFKEQEAFYIPINHDDSNGNLKIGEDKFYDYLRELFSNKDIKVIGQNLKYDMNVLHKYNIVFNCQIEDTMILSYIYNSSRKHDLDSLSDRYLDHTTIKYKDIVGSGAKQKNFSEVTIDEAVPYACEDADLTFRLYNYLSGKLLKLEEQSNLYHKVELPLVKVIANIEQHGVMINAESLEKQSKDLESRIKDIEKNVYKHAQKEFNISSPKQIQEIFYNDLNLPVLKKTPKGQPSTNEEVMEELSLMHELPKLILQFRNLMKLKNTYTDKLGKQINETTQRLHTSYNQTVTITGRLSSSNPNLQNIPIKTQDGKNIRKTFIAKKGHKIISADYSQIELRVMAHLSQDKNLLTSFMNGEDVHASTAKEVFSLKDEPSEEQRRAAKAINFGLIYGISSYGLSKQLKIDNSSAKDYIDKYFLRYSGIKEFMDIIKIKAKKNGYASTLLGRRIYIPNITHSNFQVRSAAERTAINAPIQGTAADILKIAMINIDKWINKGNYPIQMIMQVHDELVFEVEDNFVDEANRKIIELMSTCYNLDVPLIVDLGIGNNWDKAH
jgi:DNA polymerase-1